MANLCSIEPIDVNQQCSKVTLPIVVEVPINAYFEDGQLMWRDQFGHQRVIQFGHLTHSAMAEMIQLIKEGGFVIKIE